MGQRPSVLTVIALAVALVVAPVIAKAAPRSIVAVRPVKIRRATNENEVAFSEYAEAAPALPDNLTQFDGLLAFDAFAQLTSSRSLSEAKDSIYFLTVSIRPFVPNDTFIRCESNPTFSAGSSPLRC